MTYEFTKPSKPLATSYPESAASFQRVSEERKDPNKEVFRSMREVLAFAAGPIAGQTRDLLFLCRGDEEFNDIAKELQNVFSQNDLLEEDEFEIDKMVTTPEKDGNASYITGELRLTIPDRRYTTKQIEAIATRAYGSAVRLTLTIL